MSARGHGMPPLQRQGFRSRRALNADSQRPSMLPSMYRPRAPSAPRREVIQGMLEDTHGGVERSQRDVHGWRIVVDYRNSGFTPEERDDPFGGK